MKSTTTGGVAKLPPPDNQPRFLKRLRELAPQWLFPNDAASVEAGSLSYSELESGEDGYIQTFVLAQIGLGVGEVVAELRALRKEVAGLRSDIRAGARAIIRRLDDVRPGNFGDDDDGDDDGDGDEGAEGDDEAGDFGDEEGEDAGGENGDFGEDDQPELTGSEDVIDAEVEEIQAEKPAATPSPAAAKPKRTRAPKPKKGGGEA